MTNRCRLFLCAICLLTTLAVACREPSPPEVPTPIALGRGAPVAVSIDGQWLLVVRSEPEWNEGWLQPVDGGEGKKILQFTATSFYATFSPDGRYLAWSSEGLWLAGPDGSDARRILADEVAGPLAWSPDSDRLAVVVGDKVKLIDLQGQERAEVVQAESIRALSWSQLSSGERVFFASFPAEQPPYVAGVSPDGQGLATLAIAEAFDVAGDRIFVAEPLSAGPLRQLSAVDGTDAKVIVESGIQSVAVRPPESGQVAYILQSDDGVSGDLWLAAADGREQRQLTAGAPILGQLWSPDGRRLYFAVFDVNAGEEDDPFQVHALDVP